MSRNSWNHLGLQSADGMLEALPFRVWIREPDWESKMKAFTEDPTHRKHLVRVEWHTLNLKSGEISETLSTMPPEARPDGTAVACGNRLYVLGGLCAADPSCPDQIFDGSHYNNCVFYFDCARPGCGWQRAPPMLVPRRSPSAVAIEGKIYVFGSTPLTECCFAEVFNIHENRWDMLPPPPVSSLDLLCSSDPVLFDHSRSRILVHFSTNHSLYAFSPAPDGGSWECLDTEFWSWANASAIVDDVAYFLFDPISDWGMELYPRIGKSFDIKVFTNCRFGMMSWAVLAVTYCIKQYEANAKVSDSVLVNTTLMLVCVTKFFWWEAGYLNTMDIAHERAGFYICWGCLVWVPSIYTSPGMQRQEFRRTSGKCKIWGKAPSKIEATYTTTSGETKTSLLLTSGWWGLARHFHYVPEILAAFFWTVPALFNHFLPYFYVVFSYHPLIRLSQKG
ncbi:hypothetical protein V6N11_063791 [Hibiscus sabdariffa]|uniref:7-dehydrocholesterol reductase n=1 Tax=Hibiscus sabdariffa TaxID=183260 RepID=A0ABR2PM32_9ROSI